MAQALRDVTPENPGHSLVVLGDVSTPGGSILLKNSLGDLHNVWDRLDAGRPATWPAIAPIWDLDQIWVEPLWKVRRVEALRTRASDHRLAVADLSLIE